MKWAYLTGVTACALAAALAQPVAAQVQVHGAVSRVTGHGVVVVPDSSIAKSEDLGLRAHTNIEVFVPDQAFPAAASPNIGPPYTGYPFETPGSIACVFGLVSATAGCEPATAKTVPAGGSKAIGIVDAYYSASAKAALAKFSSQFGLPAPSAANFEQIHYGATADSTGGWDVETDLDIEWAHAMAPKAKIILVEAATNSNADLATAEKRAISLVSAAGGGEVSNSWGGSEYSGETSRDTTFTGGSHVVVFFSSGDTNATEYPAVSTKVIGVGGLSVRRKWFDANYPFAAFGVWSSEGAGPSPYVAAPAFQKGKCKSDGVSFPARRCSPDITGPADPSTPAWVYVISAALGTGWETVGGTSWAAPSVAGMTNLAGHFAADTAAEQTKIYGEIGKSSMTDITVGECGVELFGNAAAGFDICSGIGAPHGKTGL